MPTRGLMRKCQRPARQEFPGGIERGRSAKDAMPGEEDGKGKEEGRENVAKCQRKFVKTVPFPMLCGGSGQWCPGGAKGSDPRFTYQGQKDGNSTVTVGETPPQVYVGVCTYQTHGAQRLHVRQAQHPYVQAQPQ